MEGIACIKMFVAQSQKVNLLGADQNSPFLNYNQENFREWDTLGEF